MSEILILFEFLIADSIEVGWLIASIRLAGYQPQYFPRLHYFARMLDSDVFTIAPYLQYVRRHAYIRKDGTRENGPSYQAHALIKARHGVVEIGVPVQRVQYQRIQDAKIDYAHAWQDKHLNAIREHYQKSPYYRDLSPGLERVIRGEYDSLGDLTIATIRWSLGHLLELPEDRRSVAHIKAALPVSPFRLSHLVVLTEDIVPPPNKAAGRDASAWLVDQCATFGADEYHFGATSACAYMDFERFKKAGIALKEQSWTCAPYRQEHGEFVSNLSIIDLLMNVSPGEARIILHTKADVA